VNPRLNKRLLLPLALLLCQVALGCGDRERVHRVAGRITFAGQPVPAGQIYFLPDSGRGNHGPAGHATIRDGMYDTHGVPPGRGVRGGAYQVRIEGHDGQPIADAAEPTIDRITAVRSKTLFRDYLVTADIGEADAVLDFDVPTAAAANPSER
jgi:hypothetical protein